MPFSALSYILPISYVLVQVITAQQFRGAWRRAALMPLAMVGLGALGLLIASIFRNDAYATAFAGILPIALLYLMILTLFRATLRGG